MEFFETFEVPDVARPVVDVWVTPQEVAFIEALPSREFDVDTARTALLASTSHDRTRDQTREFLRGAYRRGILRLRDETFSEFEIATFYTRLDIFAVTEPETFGALSAETRSALDAWFLGAYVESLGDDAVPTSDRVVTLDDALAFIDTVDRPIWLNRCDCRTLAGECDQPVDTCITFRSGINTLSDRGWSTPLTKAEAKDVVRRANRAGLMQTVNDDGICNCCSDCCYLFRAQAARGSGVEWPLVTSVALINIAECIECGACVARCPFGALELDVHGVRRHDELCRGCGLCAQSCPTSAITIVSRDDTERFPQ